MDWSPPSSYVHGISRQEYWSGLPFPSLEDLPKPGIEPVSLAMAGGFFTTEPPGKPLDSADKDLISTQYSISLKPNPYKANCLGFEYFR